MCAPGTLVFCNRFRSRLNVCFCSLMTGSPVSIVHQYCCDKWLSYQLTREIEGPIETHWGAVASVRIVVELYKAPLPLFRRPGRHTGRCEALKFITIDENASIYESSGWMLVELHQ